ncbi:non-ribosomal peptide synthetase, partial [Rhizobium rhizogenes]|uniref:non-ribosomal peptide synthetase n=1 Tax=Rhizobium rhizogenes TaxID=359 RepID=UPI00157180F9
MTPQQKNKILRDWNMTEADYPAKPLHVLFEEQASRSPNAAALIHNMEITTYRDLNRRANQVARHLQRLGVGMEMCVGIHIKRSVDFIIAALAVLKVGAAFVPLDPAYPLERRRFMVESAGTKLVIESGRDDATMLQNASVESFAVWDPRVSLEESLDLDTRVSVDAAAYVVFTSGSTGTPNGVVGLHRGAVNRCAWMWRRYPYGTDEISALKTSPNFVDSIWEMFGPLLQGIPSAIIDGQTLEDIESLIGTLASSGATRIVLVPSLLSVLLEMENLGQRLPKLRYWTSSGEALSASLVERFYRLLPGRVLLNLYGSSEASGDSTALEISPSLDVTTASIGRPIDNTRVYILDSNLEPVGIGTAGDVYIAGDGLAQGYISQPRLTAERFLPDPNGLGGARMYRTGDRGRYLADGIIEYLGRSDSQVKLRGMRVDLGEIEALLRKHPAITEAAVRLATAPTGERIVAYIVGQDGSAGHLRAFLSESLPDYMVPSAFVTLDALPLTPNGKIDRRALPDPS